MAIQTSMILVAMAILNTITVLSDPSMTVLQFGPRSGLWQGAYEVKGQYYWALNKPFLQTSALWQIGS